MALSLLLVLTTVILGYAVSRQLLGAQRAEALCLAPLWACLAIIGAANAWGPVEARGPIIGLAALLTAILWAWPPPEAQRQNAPPSQPSGRGWEIGLGTLFLLILGYVLYAQAFTLDTDNWVHEPVIAGFTLGIFPPVHPFFPEVEMHGHYGRDLLIGTLLPRTSDPLLVVWWLNPVLALCSAGVLVSIFRRWGDPPCAILTGLALPFFGICVGFRVGLVDSFDGNNGLVYALAIALFHALLRVFDLLPSQRPGHLAGLWCAAGYGLGTYQLVYETHFGLFLLTGAVLLVPALARSSQRRRTLGGALVTAAVALTLACNEGGPLTDLAWSSHASSSQADSNKGQHVSMAFPKTELFKVKATSADYQRLSPGWKLPAFRDKIPSTAQEGYLSIFSPSFLVTHWLPVLLAPLTLLWLLWRRHWPGLAFWLFGAWAYLVPGLIDFGPIYEWEYFRWEFAAGFAFSVPLGLMIGSLLNTPGAGGFGREDGAEFRLVLTRKLPLVLAGWVLLVLALWPGEKMINRAIIEIQKNGWPTQFPPGDWRVARPELGVCQADIRCAQRLASQILPGESVLTNLGSESPLGLWPDSVVSALSGARVAGRAHPPEGRRLHAHPNYHRSSLQKALTASARPDLLWNSGVSWLLLDPQAGTLDEALAGSPHALLECREKTADGLQRELWKLAPPPSLAIERCPSQPPFRSQTLLLPAEGGALPLTRLQGREWRCGKAYRLRIDAFNARPEIARLGWLRIRIVDQQGADASDPISYLLGANPLPSGTGDRNEVVFVTPISEGNFTVIGELLTGPTTSEPLFSFPIELSLQARLEQLRATLEVPGDVTPKSFAALRLFLESDRPLQSRDELELQTRLREVGGDYVWELDRQATPLSLALDSPAGSPEAPEAGRLAAEWNITAPWREGVYELELEIFDKATGTRVPLKLSAPSRITVVNGP
jgi:hypothetical protein